MLAQRETGSVLRLCPFGAGGSSCGARLAGARLVAGIDRWPLAIEAYRLNYPDARTYESDLETLSPQRIAREVGNIELLLASPECTNHSIARGGADPDEKSQNTAFQVTRFAEVLKPRWIIIENVVKMRQWRYYDKWLKKPKAIGYENPVQVTLDAQHYGVAQSRKRLFIICDREGIPQTPHRQPGPKPTVKSILTSRDERGNKWPFAPLKSPSRAGALSMGSAVSRSMVAGSLRVGLSTTMACLGKKNGERHTVAAAEKSASRKGRRNCRKTSRQEEFDPRQHGMFTRE